jgi:hypothetical protein
MSKLWPIDTISPDVCVTPTSGLMSVVCGVPCVSARRSGCVCLSWPSGWVGPPCACRPSRWAGSSQVCPLNKTAGEGAKVAPLLRARPRACIADARAPARWRRAWRPHRARSRRCSGLYRSPRTPFSRSCTSATKPTPPMLLHRSTSCAPCLHTPCRMRFTSYPHEPH